MTRNIANRLGYSIKTAGKDGGIFNLLTQFVLNKQEIWNDFHVSVPATYSPQTYVENGYEHVVFTGSSDFTVTGNTGGTIEYMVVGGGGCAGYSPFPSGQSTGGGGAGGLVFGSIRVNPGVYTVTIGAGAVLNTTDSKKGEPSSLAFGNEYSIVAQGGGRGGAHYPPNSEADIRNRASPGGSGGGGGGEGSTIYSRNSGSGTNQQGYPGAYGSPNGPGGGGGGAGKSGGTTYSDAVGGDGLAYQFSRTAIPNAFGTPGPTPGRWFAGGGAGGGGIGYSGGAGGGGTGKGYYNGSPPPNVNDSTDGSANTGGGGGGTAYDRNTSDSGPQFSNAKNGGSGIIIIRYYKQ